MHTLKLLYLEKANKKNSALYVIKPFLEINSMHHNAKPNDFASLD
jgi:hypothetical protein